MIEADLHSHSHFSLCGLHSFLELITFARAKGMKALAITDHALTLGGRLTSVFFERFQCPYDDFVLWKGVECNCLDHDGVIDIPVEYLRFLDIVLLGLHPNLPRGLGKDVCTEMMVHALEKNPQIDILTHLNDPHYPVDYRKVAVAARKTGAAIELNNSKILYSRSPSEDALEILTVCKELGVPLAINSDAHCVHELGLDDSVRPLLQKTNFPENLIINRTIGSAREFIESRRHLKK